MDIKGNKRILITAGPTWVPIDDVRVISNIATGETGILLAREAEKLGFKVTLFLGPAKSCHLNDSIRLFRFDYFDELRRGLRKELKARRYDYVIHSAAVSDFEPDNTFKGKIGSHKGFIMRLKPLPKIISEIRNFSPESKLVMFKLESGVSDSALIKRARAAQDKVGADLIVANRLKPYRAFIIDRAGKTLSVRNKAELSKKLLRILN